MLKNTDPVLWDQEKEDVSHNTARRNTAPGALTAREHDSVAAGIVPSRAESAPEIRTR